MAFSTEMREELSHVPCERQCCALAEIVGMVLSCGGLSYRGQNKYGLEIRTESAQVARRYFTMCRRWLNAGSEIRIAKTRQLGEHVSYTLTPADEDVPGMLAALDLTDEGEPFGLRPTPSRALLRKECCRKAFLRGAYLAGGSVNNPERAYHMEIAVTDERLSAYIAKALSESGVPAKRVKRKTQWVTYVKSAEHIADLMALLGASKARTDFEEIRLNKGLRNEVNRQINCDSSNMDKSILASEKQISIIETIVRRIGMDGLPEPLRDIAELRLKYPDASLSELGGMATPALTKSGVNARMRKLEALAEELVNS